MVKYFVALVFVASCSLDPVRDEAARDLGPEEAGVPEGPLHRPDQPCLVCHSDMSVAGTIHAAPDAPAPVANVVVTLTDARGSQTTATTNAAGNFFVETSAWAPTFPIHASIALGSLDAIMSTEIGRDGSCASCHVAPTSRISAGLVFLAPAAALLPDGGT
ncbi:MAG TPA: hypothetical protein VH054_12695 [Polyangiaceae bacterium]|jgi:hypothetical protein|nr:hypothetical protein [Polyangiaceae bacterium]